MSLQIVVLAAGQGKRMYSSLPKVLHRIAGKPLLGHVLDTARCLSPDQLVVVYGHGGDQVLAAFSEQQDISWAHQAEQLGTGHAVRQAMPHVQGGVTLILYGDVPLTRQETLERLLAATDHCAAIGLLTDYLPDPTGYGRIVRDGANRVVRIVEQKDATAAEQAINEINTGMMAVPTARLDAWLNELRNDNAQGEYYLTDIIALAVRDGLVVNAVQPSAHWEAEGINNKLQLAQLERIFQRNAAQDLLIAGVTLADPARIDLRGELIHGQDVSIDVNCIFEGVVELGNNVSIGAHCVLKNMKVADNVTIQPFCHLEDAQIGAGGMIGPYARLRPGAQLAENVHVGNFVEIKKSEIGIGSKVNHLTYVGDASVGAGVNVGAGTITCNYDGVNKSRTIIGDNAFIGSNTCLVAPVEVGAGATTGAGSVITKNAPAGELSISRARQSTVSGWSRPQKK
ncbi:MAG: bifunctional UDP-N-acetylglucosamine diphosphorylase/glucosamine-1-phosphate N-acetyltransferase GlmU [Formivibrio sp.]|nr:bifunctional UDP-N-acetylglucosamine diphosphorylase/glucosamine-1-phosphate N-acetyltransferase GlmU [Formivibrio sp.]